MKKIVLALGLIASTQCFAFDPYSIRKEQSPDFTGVVDVPLQLAVRNVRIGLIKCNDTKKAVSFKRMIFVDSLFPDLKEAEIIGYASTPGVSFFGVAETKEDAFLLYIFNGQDDTHTKIEAWSPSAGLIKLGSGLERFTKPIDALAKQGEKINCDTLKNSQTASEPISSSDKQQSND